MDTRMGIGAVAIGRKRFGVMIHINDADFAHFLKRAHHVQRADLPTDGLGAQITMRKKKYPRFHGMKIKRGLGRAIARWKN